MLDAATERLLRENPDILALLEEEMGLRPPKVTKVSCKVFKLVNVVESCLHCGSKHSRQVALMPASDLTVVSRDGGRIQITYKQASELLTITSFCSFCEDCRKEVEKWSREELEDKYLALLKRASCLSFRK